MLLLLTDSLWFPWTVARQAFLSLTISQSLPRYMSIESVSHPTYLILCRPLLLLPSIFLSIRVFSNESAVHIRWPKYWSFKISPSKEHSGLISFKIDLFGLLAFQGTLKSLLQHHRWKVSIFQHSAFITFQPTPVHDYWKDHSLDLYGSLLAKWCLCFLKLSRFVIAFLPRSNCLNFMASVTTHSDFRAQEEEICHCFHLFPFYLPWSDGLQG